ncbi:cation channel sperm-associated protein subunit delta [Vombatus ursinus]|uniref:cation channel sperm-associated protein subunit delta n=1 Tax=Vombatus ursinus TaxID=29139 RepID=UPI000FFD9377|nr:cation channel sperm-associated protein subunit delta [Vombatus ursinus]
MSLTRLPCACGFVWLLAVVAVAWLSTQKENDTIYDMKLCSIKQIRTGKIYRTEAVEMGDVLFYAYDKPRILKHPCKSNMALYMGNALFLTKDNFHSSLLPLNLPKMFAVKSPNVSAAVYSSSCILLIINGNVYAYDYEDGSWSILLITQVYFTNIYTEYCCYSNDYSCSSVNNLILVYAIGGPVSEAVIYISNSLGFNFEELHLPQLKLLNGTFEGIFFFHSMSKFAVLLKNGDTARFAYTEPPQNETWGLPFPMSRHLRMVNLPGLKGFLIFWHSHRLLFSHNSGQLVEDIPIKEKKLVKHESFGQSGKSIYTIAGYENELAVLTTDFHFYYGTLGLLSTSLTKIAEEIPVTKDSALMFESVGNVMIVSPGKDVDDQSYDFTLCCVNMQYVLMELEIGLKSCKAEILHGDFDKKMHVLDMGETLELSAQLVPQPSQLPIPIVTVSNPHSLGFQVKMYEDGYTFEGNTKFTINITLMQQHTSGRAHESFISNVKIPSLSTITLDLIERGMSCIDLQPPSGLISIGCNWKKKIIVRRDLNACVKKFLKPVELENNYTYIIEKGSYDPNYHSRPQQNNVDLTIIYDYEELGCPGLVYYNSPWKPVIELWEETRRVEVVKTEFVLIEIHGLYTYNYSMTVGEASCVSQAQNWSSMIDASTVKGVHSWNRQNYLSCHEDHESAPLLWPNVEYQVLGGSTKNSIIFDQRNGIYVFLVRIVDPFYSYCDLTTTFSIYVYGAFPKQVLPDYLVFIVTLGFMLIFLWLGYIIPKLLKSEHGQKLKSFFQNLLHKNKKEKVKFNLPKSSK